EQNLATQRRFWETRQTQLENEAEGLENRIRNLRQKLVEVQKNLAEIDVKSSGPSAGPNRSALVATGSAAVAPAAGAGEVQAVEQLAWHLQETEAELHERFAALENLAGELADQRLHLTEQCERLHVARQQWNEERNAATAELEAIRMRLQEQAQTFALREQALVHAESVVRQQQEE